MNNIPSLFLRFLNYQVLENQTYSTRDYNTTMNIQLINNYNVASTQLVESQIYSCPVFVFLFMDILLLVSTDLPFISSRHLLIWVYSFLPL